MNQIKIALVGQPNVGKSMLINSISNASLHTGNFTGVTVEKKEISFKYKEHTVNMVDLPGTYMLSDYSTEEKITNNFLHNEDYDIILNVVDSTNLERNLQLSVELLNMNKKMIIALNMSDEAQKEGISIDSKHMSSLLGVDVVQVSALSKDGLDALLESIIKTYDNDKKESKLVFSKTIEEEIGKIVSHLKINKFNSSFTYRSLAIDLISQNKNTLKTISKEPIWDTLSLVVSNSLKHIKSHYNENSTIDIFANEFMVFNKDIVSKTSKISKPINHKTSTTQKIDAILIHPIFGIPIFLFFMWSLFQITFELGSIPMDYIDAFFAILGDKIGSLIANDDFRSLVVDGLIAGVGAVMLFVPNIVILFAGIALIESVGYMSRVAYLLDGIFNKFGLHGQSFIPLVTGFGCSIPAYMSARILKNNTDRMITLFIIGFMSCGAKLPVYVLFVGSFFGVQNAGNILFFIYMGGALIGLLMAKILKLTAFKGENEPFVMEMSKYRMPSPKLIWHMVKSKTMMYIKKAGTFIAGASMLVWFGSNYPHNIELSNVYELKIQNASTKIQKISISNELNEKLLEQSYLGQIGKFIEPIFTPLGMDWKMAVALQTGLAAKEVVVSTLGVLYSLGADIDETSNSLMKRLSDNISFASAISFIIIMMTYLPCFAAVIVFAREAGGVRYIFYLFVLTSVVAYILAFIGYHLALY